MSAIDYIIYATRSDCYNSGDRINPDAIVVHSTGCNNPNLKRYVQPDNGAIGSNPYSNSWNEPGYDVCVHAAIGKNKNGDVKTAQVLPWNYRAWGVADGRNGSFNNNAIQFEMLEDGLSDKAYCKACYDKAVELCVYLCKTYKIKVNRIYSHHEVGIMGYGSQHIDPDNWWAKFGFTMDQFRKDVNTKLTEKPVLEKSGYEKGDKTIGSLALKEMLLIAKKLGINKYGMDENQTVGDGTVNAINCLLDKWGYKKNGIAGEKFIKKLAEEIRKKV